MSLAEALEGANLAVLLAAMVHLTGDESLLDRDDARSFYRLRNPTNMSEAVAAEIRAHALEVLSDPTRWPHRTPSPDELLRIATFCAGEPIAPEYTALIHAEADFEGSDPRRFVWPEPPPAETLAAFPVAIIGAGLAGVCAAIRLSQAGIPFTIYEKNDGVGGTWYENDYPALRVDVPNHFYSYSFAPNPDWTDYYSRRDELQAYVDRCVDAFGVRPHIELETEVLAADFDHTRAQWSLRVRTAAGAERVVEHKAVISAVGMLNRRSVPHIDGLESFTGPAFHSSHWPADLDVSGRRVGVIGTGASAVQVVPGIADEVGHLDVFQRSRHWMTANPVYLQRVSDEEHWLFRNVPYYRGWYRFLLFWNNADRLFPAFRIDPD
ncbi:MAG: NAD(P)-binding protein, partial [Acidimicrobiia bacterium]